MDANTINAVKKVTGQIETRDGSRRHWGGGWSWGERVIVILAFAEQVWLEQVNEWNCFSWTNWQRILKPSNAIVGFFLLLFLI